VPTSAAAWRHDLADSTVCGPQHRREQSDSRPLQPRRAIASCSVQRVMERLLMPDQASYGSRSPAVGVINPASPGANRSSGVVAEIHTVAVLPESVY